MAIGEVEEGREQSWDKLGERQGQLSGRQGMEQWFMGNTANEDVLHAMLEALLENTPDVVLFKDTNHVIRAASHSLGKLLGFRPEELIGKTDFDLFPAVIARSFYEEEQYVLSGETIVAEHQVPTPEGLRWLEAIKTPLRDESGQVIGLFSSERDVTERKQVEEQLRVNQARYRAIVEDQTELICRFLPDGTLTFVNEAYCRYFDKRKEDLVGKSFMPLVYEADLDIVKQCLASLKADNPVGSIEHRVVLPDGQLGWHQWTNRAILDARGEIIEFQAVGRDITAHKIAEEREQRYIRDLAFLSRTATLFVSLASDEDIYRFIGDCLLELAGNALVFVGTYEPLQGQVIVRAVCSAGEQAAKVLQKVPLKADEIVLSLTEKTRMALTQGRILHASDEFKALPFSGLPEVLCTEIAQSFEVGNVYALGFSRAGELFGMALVLQQRGSSLGDATIIETFVNQASVALQRKRAEDALRASEARYRSLYSSVNEGVAIKELVFDGSGEPVDYRILDVNPAYELLTGLSSRQVLGRRMSEILGINGEPPYLEVYAEVVRTGQPKAFEIAVKEAGRIFWELAFPVEGYRFATIFQDITERKRTETLLHVQRDLGLALATTSELKDALRSCVEAAMRLSGMEIGSIYLVDRVTRELRLGYVTGVPDKVVRVIARYSADSEVTRFVLTGNIFCGAYSELPVKLAEAIQMENLQVFGIIPVFYEGQVIGSLQVGSCTAMRLEPFTQAALETIAMQVGTVVGRLMAKAELEEKDEQLRQMQKMEALGRLAGGIAHDFDNIFANILGYASLVRSRLPSESPMASEMDIIIRSCQRASELTAELLTFARGGIIHALDVDLNEVVREVIELLWDRLDPNIEVDLQLAGQPVVVKGDAPQLHQVVLNLTMNAVEAMVGVAPTQLGGGRLTIETKEVLLDEAVAQSLNLSSGWYAYLRVSDTGKGMDDETLKRIFDPFFTTKIGSRPHAGLGLATVYAVVQAHGGVVKAGSTPGAGATFFVYLPLTRANQSGLVPMPTLMPGARETVLVIEDDLDLLNLAHRVLEENGYVVIDAHSGEEAIALTRERGHELALAILDMLDSPMDAVETYRELQRVRPDLKTLLLTGCSGEEQARQLLSAGVAGHLQKPYSPEHLLQAVRQVLNGEA